MLMSADIFDQLPTITEEARGSHKSRRRASRCDDPIIVVFSQSPRVAGDTVDGEVLMNFKLLAHSSVERIKVELIGNLDTHIAVTKGDAPNLVTDKLVIVHDSATLWTEGEAYPPLGTDILKLPFRFTLPLSGLLPSCDIPHSNRYDGGKVTYCLRLTIIRPGFQLNKQVSFPFSVLPTDSKGAEINRALVPKWKGPWRSIVGTKDVRRCVWGKHGNVKWTLSLPLVEDFPILTPIPFVLNIVTTSKPMKWENTPANCPIFPALPHTPDESIDFTIVRDVYLRAGRYRSIDRDAFVANVGGFGKQSAIVADESPMHVEAKEKVWCPLSADKNVGSWRQEVTFTSSFVLRCAPTFCSRIMILEYALRLRVRFPGFNNNIKGKIPLRVVSNISPSAYLMSGPRPQIDLPRSYFAESEWEGDDKDMDRN